ncbi:MAG: glmU [Pseudonocardia sp.]|nr:glmU [Pseudonocardia sp.]
MRNARPDPDPGSPGPGEEPVALIVLAAGAGTRMRSATAKVLHEIAGRSLLSHAVHAAAGLKPRHLVVVTGHGRAEVEQHVDRLAEELDREITVADQAEQRGTGDAVACGLGALPGQARGTVLITYADVPLLDTATLLELASAHAAAGNAVTILTTRLDDPTGYGRIVRGPDGRPTSIVEHSDATAEEQAITEVNAGVYAFDLGVLRDALDKLDSHNVQGELYLTDVLAMVHAAGLTTGAVTAADAWLAYGVNDRVQLAAVRAELNRRLLDRWMRAGVTVVDPATTWVDADVALEPDVVLHPGTQLHGRTTVGARSVIGPDTTLTDCAVGDGASVVRSHGSDSTVGAGGSVGPFAYLRPGARLGAGGKIGTFVEVKNSEIGAGSKVPHLTYVGDATIGEHSNIGASSVFVNYDGVSKHRAVVGSHVRTGSDNTFVAPVQIGDGAYTGAGAVIREDVPPGALAVSAGTQRILEGWVARNRDGTAAAEAAARALAATNGSPADDEEASQP